MNRLRRMSVGTMLVALALGAGSCALAASASSKGKNNRSSGSARVAVQSESRSGSTFSAELRFEEARRVAVERGYVGYDALPPGIRKNLARGKPLPPGIAKKAVPAPVLEVLPERPDHEWRVCGADLVLVAKTSGVVAEVAIDLFR